MLSEMSHYHRRNYTGVTDNPINNRWPQDEIDILDGNCNFNVDYLGCVEVSEPTNSKTIRESFAQLYEDYTTGIRSFNPAVLWITGYELRIVDKTSKNLILAQIIGNVLYCASVEDSPNQVFYTCRDVYNDRWLCHLFIVKNCFSDRLCRAIGFSFRVCLKRKIIREGYSADTMKSRSIG